jgi:hypothetical protein
MALGADRPTAWIFILYPLSFILFVGRHTDTAPTVFIPYPSSLILSASPFPMEDFVR